MKRVKAGKRGEVIKYISRAKAIRKLQLSLKDFRKLCILKGVYPREPPKKLKRTSKTYYHLKDVNFLATDPIIEKIRAQKVYTKKYKKAKSKGDIGKIQYLVKHKPNMSLNHLVRERYPEFIDALRDLDDPLSLMALFTIFPAHKEFNLTGDKIDLCAKLLKHFELYVIRSHALRKVFVSLKGIYYQAEIMDQKITYIVPFKYPADLPLDVDYRVMVTFLDFYLVMLKFVNFKLYSMLGLEYPPTEVDATTYQGYEIGKIQGEKEDDRYKIDEEFREKEKSSENLLFSGLKFYLNTEVPRYSLEYVILACGGEVELENNDASITHVITDRDNVKT
jgi:pescadillo protein